MRKKKDKKSVVTVVLKEGFYHIKVKIPVSFSIIDTKNNKKLLLILLRLFVDEKEKRLLTFQQIADLLGYPDRRNVNNFWREFVDFGCDMLRFLQRKKCYEAFIPEIERFAANNLHLPVKEMHKRFLQSFNTRMCLKTFVDYLSQINCLTIIRQARKLLMERISSGGDAVYLLKMLSELNNIPKVCDDLLAEFPKEGPKKRSKLCSEIEMSRKNLCLFVHYLIASGLNFETIATLLNTCKSNVSALWHEIEDFHSLMVNSIERWSGKIAIDEKYLKIKGDAYYIISIVDFVTGLPLFLDLYPDTKRESYEACFRTFKQIYRKSPKMIVSDGSKALAAAREKVFPNVHYQFCKFHKIRNLFKRINQLFITDERKNEMKNKIKRAFKRKTVSGRKKALIKLMSSSQLLTADYINNNILKEWRHLSKGLTSNVSERFNRKIKKVLSGRYGLKSEKTARLMVLSLWFKELVDKGKPILHQNSIIATLNISQVCQEKIKWQHLNHLFDNCDDEAA